MAVTAMLQAGLGNQLFIYGAALAMARRLQTDLILDTALFRFDIRRSYELGFFDTGATEVVGRYQGRSIKRQDTSNWPAKFAQYLTVRKLVRDPNVLMERSKSFDPRTSTWGSQTKLLGYFQSWRYLEPVADEIRQRVSEARYLTSESRSWVNEQVAQLESLADPVLVHVRRGDYLLKAHREFHGLLGGDYYRRALELVAKGSGYKEVVVVSDDENAALEVLDFVDNPIFIRQPSQLPDCATLLATSRLNKYVIANSSYSWWLAWLSRASTVVAPHQWFGRDDLDFSDVCPKAWHLI